MRNKIIMLICILVLSTLCGCAGNQVNTENTDSTSQTETTEAVQSEDNMVVLTERQKQILREKGLPEEYDQLTDSQKNAIVKIERALAYLEETYNDEFEYYGYVSGGLDGEYVTAKISDTYPAEYVNVYILYENDHYEYSDNYKEIMAEPEYAEQVTKFLANYLDPSDFKVYVKISELSETGDSIIERAVGVPVIMINDVYSEKEVEKTVQAYAEWISSMDCSDGGGVDFRFYKTEDYMKIDEYNYKEYYGKDLLWLMVSVDSDKSIEIQRY